MTLPNLATGAFHWIIRLMIVCLLGTAVMAALVSVVGFALIMGSSIDVVRGTEIASSISVACFAAILGLRELFDTE